MSAVPPAPGKPLSWRYRALRLLGFAGATYLVLVIMLLFLENSFIYFPAAASVHWQAPPAELAVEDVWLETAEGNRIHGWWCPAPGATGALLYCHGNAGNLSHRGPVVPLLTKALGLSVLLFDYPGYGKSEGKPSEAGCYAAANAAYDWLVQQQQIAPRQIVLFGKSLGGAVATDLAVRHPHRALVLLKSFTSIPDMAQASFPFLPARWLCRNRMDNLEKIRQCAGPIFIGHGVHDDLIPFAQGKRLFEAAPEPKRFLLLEPGGHNDGLPAAFFDGLAQFLKETAAAN